MSRIAPAFEKAAREKRAALVIYLCAGDPDLDTTVRLVLAAAEAGADVIELGMPFSDPTADGPAIQRASERALRYGTKLAKVLDVVRAVRKRSEVPILLFGYYNPLMHYGEAKIAKDAKDAGIDGFLVVDLPPEEAEPLRTPAVALGLDFVPLVAPTSTDARRKLAAEAATSFLYYVSITGVTGAASADLGEAAKVASELEKSTGKKVALGFGVKTPDDVKAAAKHVSGVVVGSAVVQAIESAKTSDDAVEAVRALVRTLSAATKR